MTYLCTNLKPKNRMIGLKEKISYGFGDMASSMFWKIFGMYMLYFYTDVFGLAPAAVGTMFLVTRIWDSVNDPIFGVIADRTRSRWGKFRPWILFGAVPFSVLGVLTFLVPPATWTPAMRLLYAYVTYTSMMMIYSAVNVPYASLLGVISPDGRDRNALSSYRMFFAYAGSFIALALVEPLVRSFSELGGVHSEARGWALAVATIGILCTTLLLLCFLGVRERVRPVAARQSSVSSDLRDLCRNRPWWILLGAGIAALIFNSIRDGATIYYFKYYVQQDQTPVAGGFFTLSALYLMIGQVSNMAGVTLAAPLSNRFGKKRVYLAAMLVATLLSGLFYSLGPDRLIAIFALQTLISICAGCIFPLLWSMYADIADYSEWKTGRRATGLIFSSSSMSQKFGWTLGGALTGWLLARYGFQANEVQSAEAIHGIRMMLSWLPAIGTVLSVIFIWFYPLDEKTMKRVSGELEARRETKA